MKGEHSIHHEVRVANNLKAMSEATVRETKVVFGTLPMSEITVGDIWELLEAKFAKGLIE